MAAALMGNLFAEAQESAPSTEVKADHPPSPQIAEEIRQKLHEPVTLEFRAIGIRDALTEVFKKHNIDFWIDEEALKDEHISLDEVEITCRLHNVSVRAALKRILAPSKLNWTCEDAGVRVTTQADMSHTLFTRVYDIAELLDAPAAEAHVPQMAALPTQMGGILPDPIVDPTRKDDKPDTPDKLLVKMVRGLTGGTPDSPWMDADGEGGMVYLFQTKHSKLLAVRQNEQAHAEIEDLMNELLSRQGDVIEEEISVPAAKNASHASPRKTVRIVTKRTAK